MRRSQDFSPVRFIDAGGNGNSREIEVESLPSKGSGMNRPGRSPTSHSAEICSATEGVSDTGCGAGTILSRRSAIVLTARMEPRLKSSSPGDPDPSVSWISSRISNTSGSRCRLPLMVMAVCSLCDIGCRSRFGGFPPFVSIDKIKMSVISGKDYI